jgi:alpha-tubulin suppressor-like RCC1 family protein
MFKAFF